MIRLIVCELPRRALACVADSCFAALARLDQVKPLPGASVLPRLRLDVAIDAPLTPCHPEDMGRPRLKGRHRPTLTTALVEARTLWTTSLVTPWDGEVPREGEVTTGKSRGCGSAARAGGGAWVWRARIAVRWRESL